MLFFYPLDFTFVCPTGITEFSKHYEKFKALKAEVFDAGTDSKFSHLAWYLLVEILTFFEQNPE